jgi:hypothetical protein
VEFFERLNFLYEGFDKYDDQKVQIKTKYDSAGKARRIIFGFEILSGTASQNYADNYADTDKTHNLPKRFTKATPRQQTTFEIGFDLFELFA